MSMIYIIIIQSPKCLTANYTHFICHNIKIKFEMMKHCHVSSPVVKRNIFQQPDLALNLGLRVRVGRQVERPEAVVDHPGHDALEVTLHPAQGRVPAAPNLGQWL